MRGKGRFDFFMSSSEGGGEWNPTVKLPIVNFSLGGHIKKKFKKT